VIFFPASQPDWIPSATGFYGGRRSSSETAPRRVRPSWSALEPLAVIAFISLLVATVTAIAVGAGVRRLAPVFGAVVPPRPDRWHSAPTPTMGGIAIAAGTIAGFAAIVTQSDSLTLVGESRAW